MKRITNAAVVAIAMTILSACGGGGGDGGSTTQTVNPKAVYPIPVLRPCETSGPSAPPCSASQAAGTH